VYLEKLYGPASIKSGLEIVTPDSSIQKPRVVVSVFPH
jgi:hypothetical protein